MYWPEAKPCTRGFSSNGPPPRTASRSRSFEGADAGAGHLELGGLDEAGIGSRHGQIDVEHRLRDESGQRGRANVVNLQHLVPDGILDQALHDAVGLGPSGVIQLGRSRADPSACGALHGRASGSTVAS